MVTAQFGTKQFQVTGKMIYTPYDTSISESINLEETEVSGSKPTSTIKGIKLQTLSFKVKLDARFVSIATEIKWWKDVLLAKTPYDFTFGEYKVGKFYLTQYDVSDIQINKNGVWTKATLSLSFTEYTAPPKVVSSGGNGNSVKDSGTKPNTEGNNIGEVSILRNPRMLCVNDVTTKENRSKITLTVSIFSCKSGKYCSDAYGNRIVVGSTVKKAPSYKGRLLIYNCLPDFCEALIGRMNNIKFTEFKDSMSKKVDIIYGVVVRYKKSTIEKGKVKEVEYVKSGYAVRMGKDQFSFAKYLRKQ